jgi:dTDP-4-dehydrorhamnose reductase
LSEKILVVGSGFLGSNIAQEFKEHTVTQTNLSKTMNGSHILNIIDKEKVMRCFQKFKPTIVINCAANTDVDFLEKNADIAYSINSEGVKNLAIASEKFKARLIHISTDGIFDGKHGMYSEKDNPNPINIYAKSKLMGEKNVIENCSDHVILRTNFYGNFPKGKSLFNYILTKLQKKEQIVGFSDVFFTPLEVSNLSCLISEITFSNHVGILNLSSNELMSKYQFCCNIAKIFNFNSSLIKKGSIEDMGFIAKRPKNTTLDNTKSMNIIKSKIVPLTDWLLKIKDAP